jgi:hypothetical protein
VACGLPTAPEVTFGQFRESVDVDSTAAGHLDERIIACGCGGNIVDRKDTTRSGVHMAMKLQLTVELREKSEKAKPIPPPPYTLRDDPKCARRYPKGGRALASIYTSRLELSLGNPLKWAHGSLEEAFCVSSRVNRFRLRSWHDCEPKGW